MTAWQLRYALTRSRLSHPIAAVVFGLILFPQDQVLGLKMYKIPKTERKNPIGHFYENCFSTFSRHFSLSTKNSTTNDYFWQIFYCKVLLFEGGKNYIVKQLTDFLCVLSYRV